MSNTIKQAIDSFLLPWKVEGKSYGTIDCYSDKLKGFLWYATILFWFNLYDFAPALDFTEYLTTGHLHVSAKGGKASDILTDN